MRAVHQHQRKTRSEGVILSAATSESDQSEYVSAIESDHVLLCVYLMYFVFHIYVVQCIMKKRYGKYLYFIKNQF